MPIRKLITTFAAGELSPLLDARTDLDSYSAGCRILKNFIPRNYGGAFRRPGTQFMGEVADHARKTRLIAFNFSTTTSFVLEFGNGTLRFWSNGAQVQSGGGPLELATPYLESQLFELQYVQINDVMFISHPSHAPRKLVRLADDNWSLTEIAWTWPALRDENVTTTTLAASGTSGTVTLTASASVFVAGHVGGYFQISHRRDAAFSELVGASPVALGATSTPMRLIGRWELFTYGTWSGNLVIERSFDYDPASPGSATWEVLRSFTSKDDHNTTANGDEGEQVWLRLRAASQITHSGTPAFRAVIEAGDSKVHGLVKVTAVASGTSATATVVAPLQSTAATSFWTEGAWSAYRGFPRAVALHEQRLIFGGTLSQPQSVWGSVIGDFENFRRSTLDDGSFSFQLAAQESNAIQWISSQAALYIGTQGDEWVISSGSDDQAITPTNVRARRQSRYGSCHLQAVLVNDVALFVQRNCRKVREFVYTFEKDGYVAPDMTIRAEHITRGGIRQWAFQQQPDSILWAVTETGRLLSMTYEREQSAVAWARHETEGEWESVACIYGSGTTDEGTPDEVWFVVKRTVGGVVKRYVERFAVRPAAHDYSDPALMPYCDSCVVYDGAATAARSGLGHLEGLSVQVLADGAVQPAKTVSGGAITQSAASAKAVVGLGFESVVQPMKLDVQLQTGAGTGRIFRVNRATVRFFKSSGCEATSNPERSPWFALSFRDTSMPMDLSVPLFSGEKPVTVESNHDRETNLALRQTQPLPLNITAISILFDVHGD